MTSLDPLPSRAAGPAAAAFPWRQAPAPKTSRAAGRRSLGCGERGGVAREALLPAPPARHTGPRKRADQQIPLPDRAVGPFGICYGPDGNIWFTELATGRIGRRSPSGEVVEFSLPAGAEPRGITAGADLNLWITDAARDLIIRMTPGGAVTEFPIPTRGGRPEQIIAGPDGNIWFSEPAADRIGRLVLPPECLADERVLCLNGGRFQASVSWSFNGNGAPSGLGHTLALTGDTGAFWFFTANNIELVVKVVDGRPLNGKFWVFVGTLTSGNWFVTIRDTQTGAVRHYQNAVDAMKSLADTGAF